MRKDLIKKIEKKYSELFKTKPLIFRSPGRINLIGEHIDYNNGFVLPAAIEMAIYIAVGKREDLDIHLYSEDYQEGFQMLIDLISPQKGWPTYVLGVVDQLKKAGIQIGGFNMVIIGDVPIGAGLSSSAALECASVFALNTLFDLRIDPIVMVKMAQKAEHEYAGVQCGIMDQFASMMGKEGYVIKLDCDSLEYKYFPLKLNNFQVVLMDTQVKHSLASSEYNIRRLECGEGLSKIKNYFPAVQTFRDVTIEMIETVLLYGSKVYKRCKYVIEEIARVEDACELLSNNKMWAFGADLYLTHEGLSTLYEVSCPELDFIVKECKKEDSILGARMMGGGFGGCVIAIIESNKIEKITQTIGQAYFEVFGIEMKVYITKIKNGTSGIIENKQN